MKPRHGLTVRRAPPSDRRECRRADTKSCCGLCSWRWRLGSNHARDTEIARSPRVGPTPANHRLTSAAIHRTDGGAATGDGAAAVGRNGRVAVARAFAVRRNRVALMVRHARHARGGRLRVLRAREIAAHQRQVEHHAHRQRAKHASHGRKYMRVDDGEPEAASRSATPIRLTREKGSLFGIPPVERLPRLAPHLLWPPHVPGVGPGRSPCPSRR